MKWLDAGGFWFILAMFMFVAGAIQGFESVNAVVGFWACMILATIEREAAR